jgi:hypothetical protein
MVQALFAFAHSAKKASLKKHRRRSIAEEASLKKHC